MPKLIRIASLAILATSITHLQAFAAPTNERDAEAPVVSAEEMQKTMNDLNERLSQPRAVPHFENGQPAGQQVILPNNGGKYQKLGLKDGDTVTAVDGQPVTDPAHAFKMLHQLKD